MTTSVIDILIEMQEFLDEGDRETAGKWAGILFDDDVMNTPEFDTLVHCLRVAAPIPSVDQRKTLLRRLWKKTTDDSHREIVFFCALNAGTLTETTLFEAMTSAPEISDRELIKSAALAAVRHHLYQAAEDNRPVPLDYARIERVLSTQSGKHQAAVRKELCRTAAHTADRRLAELVTFCDDAHVHLPAPRVDRNDYERDPEDQQQRADGYGLARYETPLRHRRMTALPRGFDDNETQTVRLPTPRGLRERLDFRGLDEQQRADLRAALAPVRATDPAARRAPRPTEPAHVTDYVIDRLGIDDDTQATAGADLDLYDGTTWADLDAPVTAPATLPCVACGHERARHQVRTASREDGLCPTCRTHNAAGLPIAARRPANAPAYLPTHTARVYAVCEWISQHYPSTTPLLLTALARQSTPDDRAVIRQWRDRAARAASLAAHKAEAAESLAAALNEAEADRRARAAVLTETDEVTERVLTWAQRFPRTIGHLLRAWLDTTRRPADFDGIRAAVRQLTETGDWAICDGLPTKVSTDERPDTDRATELPQPAPATVRVLNKHTDTIPEDAISVMRPSIFGNPFSHLPSTTARYRVATRIHAVSAYREWVLTSPEAAKVRVALPQLRGHDLVCCCAPRACHAHVLAELANTDPQPPIPRTPADAQSLTVAA